MTVAGPGGGPRTSIITLCYNQVEYTTACIESILKHTTEPIELVFVNNGSTDGTQDYLESLVSGAGGAGGVGGAGRALSAEVTGIKVVHNDRNLGFAAGVNQGIREATGDFILLLNNDVIVTPGWLGGLLTYARRSARIGLVGPMSNYVVGPQQVLDPDYDLGKLDEYARAFSQQHAGRLMRVSRVIGFCMLIRREVVDRIGGFDITFGTGNFEDDDFCLRAVIAGFDIVIAGDVFVHHFGSVTFKGARMDYVTIMRENASGFAEKWGIELSARGYNPLPILARRFDPASHYFPLISEWSSKALLAESVRLFEQGRLEASHVAVAKALELEPGNPDALHNMALIAMSQGDFHMALEAWEKVPPMSMDSERFNLKGVCHFQMGDADRAARCFRRAIELDPACPGAQENLEMALVAGKGGGR